MAELDLASQVKLLRVLQDREFRRVGRSEVSRCDVRVVAAANRDLKELVGERKFREDLYYRLNLITLELPPLRARRGDIASIADDHLGAIRKQYGLGDMKFAADAHAWLDAQAWPGNIRQLRQSIERAALLADHAKLTRADFEATSGDIQPAHGRAQQPDGSQLALDQVEKLTIQRAMAQAAQNITRAAEILGVSRAALYRRLAKYGLVRE